MSTPTLHLALLLATGNPHKTGEVRALLGPEWSVTDLSAFPHLAAPEETGLTFRANAEIKALAAAAHFPGLVLADDSGLEVEALEGAPGVRSARYAGEGASDAANRARLLAELDRVEARGRSRTARFCCALALAQGGRLLGHFEGAVEGVIIPRERGAGGFGYDALFIPDGECATLAELPPEVKNRLSHRGRALAQALAFLRSEKPLPAVHQNS